MTPAELSRELSQLGVRAGGICMVHASLRALGPVAGGAAGVIEAIEGALGERGTMLMMIAADDEDPFDALTTPVDVEDMGVLAEVFRTTPGTLVSDHPACRFAAKGPSAASLLSVQPLHDYYGPGSTLERFAAAADGQVLRLGANIDTVTLTHHAEYLADFPDKRCVRRRYVRADVGEIFVDSLDDSKGIRVWSQGDYFPQILVDHINQGHASVGPVGDCRAELLEAGEFVRYATKWLERVFGAPGNRPQRQPP